MTPMEEEGSKGLFGERLHPEDFEYFIISDCPDALESENREDFTSDCQPTKVDVVSYEVESLSMVDSTKNLLQSKHEEEISNKIVNDIDSVEYWVDDTQTCASENCHSTLENCHENTNQTIDPTRSDIDSYPQSLSEAIPKGIPRWIRGIVLLVILLVLRHAFLASRSMPIENVCGVQHSSNRKLQQPTTIDLSIMDPSIRYQNLLESVLNKLDLTVKLIEKQENEIRKLQIGFETIVPKYNQMEHELYRQQLEGKKEREERNQLQKLLQKHYNIMNVKENEHYQSKELLRQVTKLEKTLNKERKRRRQLQKRLQNEKSKRRMERKKRRRIEKQLRRKCNRK